MFRKFSIVSILTLASMSPMVGATKRMLKATHASSFEDIDNGGDPHGDGFEKAMTVTHKNRKLGGPDEEVFDVGFPQYGGTGCPGGSVGIAPSFESESGVISVIFDEYYAITDDQNTRPRKSCNLALPIKAKPGISIGIFQVDYRGYAYIPPGRNNYAKFNAEYFFAGHQGPTQSRTYGRDGHYATTDYYDDTFFAQDEVGAIVWTPCGDENFNFRINTSLSARKDKYEWDDVEIGMDTMDIIQQDGFHYYMRFRRC